MRTATAESTAERMGKKGADWIYVLILIALVVGIYWLGTNPNTARPSGEKNAPANKTIDSKNAGNTSSLLIASWNVQILGDSKASRIELMDFYASKLEKYDLAFVLELRDSDNSTLESFCSRFPSYECRASSRAGRSNSKEQIIVLYRKGIELVSWHDYNPDALDRWERPPLEVGFDFDGRPLRIYVMHDDPDEVASELGSLEQIVDSSGPAMIIGDLNADCIYYPKSKRTHFLQWEWVVPDSADTTTAATDCAYDRIILEPAANRSLIDWGIDSEGVNASVSDHYLIWARIGVSQPQ